MFQRCWLPIVFGLAVLAALPGRAQEKTDPFRRDNLVAWCIVPFDSQKRTPAQRAQMLEKMGIRALAYDYRAEHIASFDEELDQLARHKIQLTAWWFPTTLNDEALLILKVLERHKVKTQLWVTGGGAPTKTPAEQTARVESEAARIRPIAEAAAKQGCTVALYNHGGWFGEPENQIAIIERLKQDHVTNVGIVYNLHHGHSHLTRFKELLSQMQPYLMALNLNGMVPGGDSKGQKILPLGTGSEDVQLLKTIRDSGYRGPIGILNHTDHDAQQRLQDNLEGLQWLLPQLDGKPPEKAPEYRTWKGAQKAALGGGQLLGTKADYHQFPLSIFCRAKLTTAEAYNILVAHQTKASGHHWELFTQAGNGRLAMYMPGYEPNLVTSEVNVCDGRSHELACVLQDNRVRLYVDQKLVADEAVHRNQQPVVEGRLALGRLVEGGLECYGEIEFVQLFAGQADFTQSLTSAVNQRLRNIDAWQFTTTTAASTATSAAPATGASTAQPVMGKSQPPYDAAVVKAVAQAAVAHGKAERGVAVFANARMACLSCHKIHTAGGSVGPELTQIGKQRTAEQLVEAVLWPNQHVEDKYQAYQVLTSDGVTLQGYKVSESDTQLVLREPTSGKELQLDKDEVEAVRKAPSLMPEGMAAALTQDQQQDLIAFLADLGHHQALRAEIAQSVLEHAQSHEAASFPYTREPLDKHARYDWQAYVNRDRLYDFYTKEANHFRTAARFEPLLAEYPGIDGGKQGHWGNQNEASWESDAWNLTILSHIQAGVFRGDKLTVGRAVCVRLGDAGQLAVCFDPDTLSYRALWQGGFVKFSKVRHGFINGMEADGVRLPLPDSAGRIAAEGTAKYLGYYRTASRIAFAYRIGDVEYLDAPWCENGQFVREVAPREKHSLNAQISQPPAAAPQSFQTSVRLGSEGAYAIDTIELPWDNPWKALIYCGDHDFLPDGSALVATMQGDIWHVSGFGQTDSQRDSSQSDSSWSTQATWKRFATGLHHALGLRVSADGIFVLCRDQLTRLHDLNHDGVADWYECYSNAFETSPAGHDYICGLQRDPEGNFYTASGNQGLVRISRDGQSAQQIAGGFRNPDGLGIYPDGTITMPCSEGEWTPASMICAVPKSKWQSQLGQPTDLTQLPFYGYRGSQYIKLPISKPELPLVYLPRGLDNSAGGQVYIDSERWGPLAGNMVHLSFGTGSYFLLLRDEVNGQLQGAVVPMPGQFLSGVHRGRFSPVDGQLYVSGMAGWGSYTTERGCFQRVRYTGQPVQAPTGFHLHENGVVIKFAQPLDREFCENAKEHFAQSWNYRYSSAYGSAEYSALHYGMRGHDQLRIASAHLLPDRHSLFLELPDLQLCNQLHLQVASASNQRFDLFATCNALDAPLATLPSVKAERKTLADHPLQADLNMATKRLPNPWRKAIPNARAMRIEAGKNLSYSTRELRAKAGEALALTLVNPDVVPHNWALIQPGTLASVGSQANQLVADPEGPIRQYVPQTSDVICYTDVVDPLDQATIYFKAPSQPGRYPFLCTFPGHWMVMNGEFVVE